MEWSHFSLDRQPFRPAVDPDSYFPIRSITKSFTVTPHQTINSLLERALNEFGVHNNRHTQSLFTEGGAELADAQSIRARNCACIS